jgi:hypothetical protein
MKDIFTKAFHRYNHLILKMLLIYFLADINIYRSTYNNTNKLQIQTIQDVVHENSE